jgi:hypothetical protein
MLFVYSSSQGQEAFPNDIDWKSWAPTPPMGWNSYDAYHGAITEKQFMEIVDILAEKYLPYGYEYAVIDFCWFNPGPEGWDPENWSTFRIGQEHFDDGSYSPTLAMDEYGRFLPAENRFPSAAGGKGFKPLADYVHSKGMKFGIHIIRGIPRQAVSDKLEIMGTDLVAGDVINYTESSWTNNTFEVDVTKPGAQEFYDSIFKLYADWGVDFVKADNMMKPFYRKGEIEMMHKAIMKCGRPIVLSQSWGEAPLSYAWHLEGTSNMWRISGDFWDKWPQIEHMFDLCQEWAPFIGGGTWPDADMLPIGNLRLGGFPDRDDEHLTQLTDEEIKSMMSLWSIARSPLMWGGDPISTPESYEKYLLNDEVLAVNQSSENNRSILTRGTDERRIWVADIPNTEDKYIALFNLKDEEQEITFDFFWEKMHNYSYKVRNLWERKELGEFETVFSKIIPTHGTGLYKFSKIK